MFEIKIHFAFVDTNIGEKSMVLGVLEGCETIPEAIDYYGFHMHFYTDEDGALDYLSKFMNCGFHIIKRESYTSFEDLGENYETIKFLRKIKKIS